MTIKNPSEKDAKTLTIPDDDAAPNAAESTVIKRKLTENELASVVAGLNPKSMPPKLT